MCIAVSFGLAYFMGPVCPANEPVACDLRHTLSSISFIETNLGKIRWESGGTGPRSLKSAWSGFGGVFFASVL
jgi:hypothetical protein